MGLIRNITSLQEVLQTTEALKVRAEGNPIQEFKRNLMENIAFPFHLQSPCDDGCQAQAGRVTPASWTRSFPLARLVQRLRAMSHSILTRPISRRKSSLASGS